MIPALLSPPCYSIPLYYALTERGKTSSDLRCFARDKIIANPHPQFCTQSNRLRPISTKICVFYPFLSSRLPILSRKLPILSRTLPFLSGNTTVLLSFLELLLSLAHRRNQLPQRQPCVFLPTGVSVLLQILKNAKSTITLQDALAAFYGAAVLLAHPNTAEITRRHRSRTSALDFPLNL